MLPDGLVELQHVVVVEAVKDLAAFFAVTDEAGGSQGAELMGDGGFRHRQGAGEVAHAEFIGGEQGNQTKAGGIGQHGEELAHTLGFYEGERRDFRVGVARRGVMLRAKVWSSFFGGFGTGGHRQRMVHEAQEIAIDQYLSVCSDIRAYEHQHYLQMRLP